MLKISAVSYLNTLPFIFGIKNSGFLHEYELTLVPPAICASNIIEGKADIALVPVGALPTITDVNVITDFCIGADGIVQSVLLLSQIPLNEIKTIHLDMQSRTSVALTQILANEFWHIAPQTSSLDITQLSLDNKPETMVCIGDKTFEWEPHYTYKYDLAAEWKKFTGLPFVFACWVATSHVSDSDIQKLNDAFNYGIQHTKDSIEEYVKQNNQSFDLEDYLTNAISYNFDDLKKEAMKLFLHYLKNLSLF